MSANGRKPNKKRMNDWLEVVLAALRSGVTVHIDIQIRADNPENLHEAACPDCGKRFMKSSPDALKRALRAHAQHCTAFAQHMQWIAQDDQPE